MEYCLQTSWLDGLCKKTPQLARNTIGGVDGYTKPVYRSRQAKIAQQYPGLLWFIDPGIRWRPGGICSHYCENVSVLMSKIVSCIMESLISDRYVIDSGYINRPTVEFNLAAICLQYLTFECFGNDISPDNLRSNAMTGILAF